ncbi:MAG TPA: C4-type zinc ribbon domain-containing protein [Pyrinomonadaceae bacterium]
MKAELEQLIALQTTDTKIRQLQAELDNIPRRRAEIEKEFDQRAFEFKQIEQRRDQARERRAQLDDELARTRMQAEKAERDLMSSTNAKAYEAAIREVDAAKKHISQLETQILEQMEAVEQAEGEIREREPEIEKLRAEQQGKLAAFEQQTRTTTDELAARRAERERLMGELPKQMSTLYNRISARIRDGVAVAEARNSSCAACFMTIRPHVMAQIRRGDEIIVCDNCSRILYYVPVEQAQRAS